MLLADVAQHVLSSPLFVRYSIVCFNNSIVNVGMKFARWSCFQGQFLIQASFLAVCCSTLSYNSGCKSVASRASFLEELSKHWSCSGSEGQFTGSHIDYSFLAWEQSKSRPRTQGFLYGFRMTAQYLFWFAFASLTFLSPT